MGLIYKDSFVVDGERYFHYSYGGKWTSDKFVTVHGINYYNSDKPFMFEKPGDVITSHLRLFLLS